MQTFQYDESFQNFIDMKAWNKHHKHDSMVCFRMINSVMKRWKVSLLTSELTRGFVFFKIFKYFICSYFRICNEKKHEMKRSGMHTTLIALTEYLLQIIGELQQEAITKKYVNSVKKYIEIIRECLPLLIWVSFTNIYVAKVFLYFFMCVSLPHPVLSVPRPASRNRHFPLTLPSHKKETGRDGPPTLASLYFIKLLTFHNCWPKVTCRFPPPLQSRHHLSHYTSSHLHPLLLLVSFSSFLHPLLSPFLHIFVLYRKRTMTTIWKGYQMLEY